MHAPFTCIEHLCIYSSGAKATCANCPHTPYLTHTHTHDNTCACIRLCVRLCMCTTVHVCMCACVLVYDCACVPLCVRLCMCATVHVALFEPMSKRHRLPLLTLSCASSVTVCCMCECAVKGDCVSGRVLVLRTPCYLSLYTQIQSCFPSRALLQNHLMHTCTFQP